MTDIKNTKVDGNLLLLLVLAASIPFELMSVALSARSAPNLGFEPLPNHPYMSLSIQKRRSRDLSPISSTGSATTPRQSLVKTPSSNKANKRKRESVSTEGHVVGGEAPKKKKASRACIHCT